MSADAEIRSADPTDGVRTINYDARVLFTSRAAGEGGVTRKGEFKLVLKLLECSSEGCGVRGMCRLGVCVT